MYEFPEQPFCFTPTLKNWGVGPSVIDFKRETAAGVCKQGVKLIQPFFKRANFFIIFIRGLRVWVLPYEDAIVSLVWLN
jgi:hypothetical protein